MIAMSLWIGGETITAAQAFNYICMRRLIICAFEDGLRISISNVQGSSLMSLDVRDYPAAVLYFHVYVSTKEQSAR